MRACPRRYTTIFKRTIITIVFAHCNCCLQFLLAVLPGLPDDCWVVRAEIADKEPQTQYLAAVFHAVGAGIRKQARGTRCSERQALVVRNDGLRPECTAPP